MKKLQLVLILLVLIGITSIIFMACKEDIVEYPVTLEDLELNLNMVRELNLTKPLAYSSEKYSYSSTEEFNIDERLQIMTPGAKDQVSSEEASKDVEMLFRIIKSSYGGYAYFGGDIVFNKVMRELMEEINIEEGYEQKKLVDIMLNNLSFIVDTHFSLNGRQLSFEEEYYYIDKECWEFHKDSAGYYAMIDQKKWYLNYNMEKYLKLTIADSGEIVYGLFALKTEEESKDLPSIMTLTSGKQMKEQSLSWIIATAGIPDLTMNQNDLYQYKEIDGIPTVSIRAMITSDEYLDETIQFIRDADKLRNEEFVILDLRQNVGGIPTINDLWLYNLTGKSIIPKMDVLARSNVLNAYIPKKNIQHPIGQNLNDFNSIFDFYKEYKKSYYSLISEDNINMEFSTNYSISYYKPSWLDRPNTLFVLMDKNTYSAAEYFLYQLSTISNVVFIGTNSNGCLTTGAVIPSSYYLPYSKIRVSFGQSLHVTDDIQGFDSRGFLPDICVGDEDAIDAVIRCYRYYHKE